MLYFFKGWWHLVAFIDHYTHLYTLTLNRRKNSKQLWKQPGLFIQMQICFLIKRKIENGQILGQAYNSMVWLFLWKPYPSNEQWHGCHSKKVVERKFGHFVSHCCIFQPFLNHVTSFYSNQDLFATGPLGPPGNPP